MLGHRPRHTHPSAPPAHRPRLRKRTASPAALLSAAALVDAYAVALPTLAGPVPALLRHPAAPGAGLRLPHCPLRRAVVAAGGRDARGDVVEHAFLYLYRLCFN